MLPWSSARRNSESKPEFRKVYNPTTQPIECKRFYDFALAGARDVYNAMTSSVLWNDVLWFQNKLWLASDYQFYQLNGGTVGRAQFDGESVPMYGHMDVHDGSLVIANLYAVTSFDGTTLRRLIAPYGD